MTRTAAAVLALLVAGPAMADTGDMRIVDLWRTITPEMGGPPCNILAGGTIMEMNRVGENVLFRYSAPVGDMAGAPCNGGELFWWPGAGAADFWERTK